MRKSVILRYPLLLSTLEVTNMGSILFVSSKVRVVHLVLLFPVAFLLSAFYIEGSINHM